MTTPAAGEGWRTRSGSDGRFLELDVLRGLAALAVVLYHYTSRFDALFGSRPELLVHVPLGKYGVHLFFVVSGYVILLTLERTRRGRDFLVSRASRLYPAYWVAVVCTTVTLTAAPLPGRGVTLWQALANLTMVQTFFGVRHVDAVYWTLQIELSFYALMLAAWVSGLTRRPLVLASVGIVAVLGLATVQRATGVRPPELLVRGLALRWLHLFAAGVVLLQLARQRCSRLVAAGMLAACVVANRAVSDAESTAVVAGILAVFAGTVTGHVRWIVQRPLVALGGLTYTLYLVHQNVGYVVLAALRARGVDANLAVLATTAMALGAAAVLTRLVERPAQRWARRRYARHSRDVARPVDAAAVVA